MPDSEGRMQPILNDVLARRRDRAIAIILGVKEREVDPHLTRDASQKLRKTVLDQINEFYDLCVDVIRSLDRGDIVINELYIDRIENKLDSILRKME